MGEREKMPLVRYDVPARPRTGGESTALKKNPQLQSEEPPWYDKKKKKSKGGDYRVRLVIPWGAYRNLEKLGGAGNSKKTEFFC